MYASVSLSFQTIPRYVSTPHAFMWLDLGLSGSRRLAEALCSSTDSSQLLLLQHRADLVHLCASCRFKTSSSPQVMLALALYMQSPGQAVCACRRRKKVFTAWCSLQRFRFGEKNVFRVPTYFFPHIYAIISLVIAGLRRRGTYQQQEKPGDGTFAAGMGGFVHYHNEELVVYGFPKLEFSNAGQITV
ncbi:hypothetical protein FN846DRAFT_514419 [Sphaerosporella brunnea]|uniref:Uncharacterized protein n=1 Tax=Sphaerosporella brunnea TaxID=1250544 RepID=A0A5J5EEE8_9PEZI|nr:hypothetical protein FN846DRAFT_514419 [Sphaerosporella brunnea]